MNEIEWIKSLDKAQPVVRVSVANSVMRTLRSGEQLIAQISPLAALVAMLAGAGAIAFAMQVWINFQDPLMNFMDSWKLVLQ